MKLNIAYPSTGCQQLFEIEDEKYVHNLMDKTIATEIAGEQLGDQFKGYLFKITGGLDKQGFPMKQGVLTAKRVRLLLSKGAIGFKGYNHRNGERLKRTVRGCIISPDISVVNMTIVKKGEDEIPGLTEIASAIPRRLGPKRANKIRKLFLLSKTDDVRKFVVRRKLPGKDGQKRPQTKAPKIQRLITPLRIQRKYRLRNLKTEKAKQSREALAEYRKLVAQRKKERVAKKKVELAKKKAEKKAKAKVEKK